ncbi:hypothetical protein ACFL5P_04565 [candidate division KSB1 bacterium]
MSEINKLPPGIKLIIGFYLVSAVLWTIGQFGAVLFYDTIASWGLQDPRELLDPVIVEVNRAIGLTDMIIMIPLYIPAAVGLWRLKFYGAVFSWLVLGINLYWPVIFWSSQFFYGQSGIKYRETMMTANVILIIILAFSIWASWYIFRNRKIFE